MRDLFIDIETYSPVDLKTAGVYRYTEHPEFEILMCAWATDDHPKTVHVAVGRDEIDRIPGLFDPAVTKIAHNANFERVCLSAHRGLPTGHYLDPEQFDDTMAVGAEWGLPRSLGAMAEALGAEAKDVAGTRLINLFSKPDRNGKRTTADDKPEQWTEFVEYCRQDVVTMIGISDRLHDEFGWWPTDTERAIWLADQRINDRGMRVDVPMAEAATAADAENRTNALAELAELTGADNPNSPAQLTTWLQSTGLQVNNLRAATVTELLAGDQLTGEQRRALELRKQLALSAAKKFSTALDRVNSDGRVRGGFQFFAAHTGRWGGRGVQPQNLPSGGLELDQEAAALLDLELGLGGDPDTLKALVRAMFTGPYVVADYSAIEARVLAWLAGEEWSLEAFRAGRDIYVETVARMFDLDPVEAKARRKQGKVAVLALGYQGGVGSLRVMGAQGSDGELRELVGAWREANQNVVNFWADLEAAFRSGGTAGRIRVERDGTSRFVILPSGRTLGYHGVKLRVDHSATGDIRRVLSHLSVRGGGQWVSTYGGRLAENCTQAVARDLLAQGLVNLETAGFTTVGHVHDEVIVEASGPEMLGRVSAAITDAPDWAKGLPLNAEAYECERYRKG